ncbi:endoplasmic reticulum mannosyl-oligosaccharide -alpha-mannosidase-like protein [Blastocystis sp. subtype 4]|uniref:endoplasmic reticulum mannosyl-oligosaccharide -alpha-mannosidase-like protein n=1 Tax=Blastocystis sp. subtype 4 TaxID=944170 RepID=UPI0007116DA3|nr:endoplasmic reticulum mannosyl-oligosaccharide -alpha-mannosidase-like protein [Blastocystis sp. subtype 4]KNB45224.1 endoplasmic reticulum mannosyl-oligosaccharide -alpha-mannosidase-like protein [Blastocystis sp. subtype 4]|eukprot:XP_014528667.1 endoplasmic reticulum mannosyl-oligosaccharide -alpha-mannosidase-like protein [Blastocystis sp. subtype 4]
MPDMYSQTIAFWIRMKDLRTPGRRTVLSTHDNLCSRQDETTVNGYAFVLEVLDNKQIRLHVIYRSKHNDCADLVVEVFESVNRWTHITVVFNNLSQGTGLSLYKTEISVYINGIFQDRTISSRYIQNSQKLLVGSDIFGSNAFLGDIASVAIFSTAINDSIIQKLSAAQAVPHTSLESLLFVIQLRRELVTVLSATSREVISAHEVVKNELTELLEREQVMMKWSNNEQTRSNRLSTSGERELNEEEERERAEEEREIEARLEKQRARHAPKEKKQVDPIPVIEKKQDLDGNTLVFFDTSRLRENMNPLQLFERSLLQKDPVYLRGGSYHFSVPRDSGVAWIEMWNQRKEEVVKAMRHFWKGYSQYAWGHDELMPISESYVDTKGHMGMTLIDSLDTLWLMGLKEEFTEGVEWIVQSFQLESTNLVSIHELGTRVLGGLLSAYELSKNEILLIKCMKVGDLILSAFDKDNLFPSPMIAPGTKQTDQSTEISLTDIGSLIVEMRHLSRVTHDSQYADRMDSILLSLSRLPTFDGLFPDSISFSINTLMEELRILNTPSLRSQDTSIQVFGRADPVGLYFKKLKKMIDQVMQGFDKQLLRTSYNDGFAIVGLIRNTQFQPRMQQYSCSLASLYAILSHLSPSAKNSDANMRRARSLGYTCYQMFKRTASGLAAEETTFSETRDFVTMDGGREFKLRPEVLEAFYFLHETTKDPIYVEWAWDIFKTIDAKCRTDSGFAHYPDVERKTVNKLVDKVHSYFTAGTMKYFYLLINPESLVNLDKTILTTGAHLLPIFEN